MRSRSLVTGLIAATALAFTSMALPATATAAPAEPAAPAAPAAAPGDGLVTPDIVGGRDATQVYPFMASMQSRSTGSHRCGASLIDPRWVVTARHCVSGASPSSLMLRIGTINRTSGGTLVGVARIFTHSSADLALMQLSAAVSQAPVRIASTSGAVGTRTRIMGWGQTCPSPGGCGAPVILQELDTSIVSDSQCSGIRGASEICTGNPGGTAGACYGDSGGPQVKSVNGVWQLIGATSRSGGGSTCAVRPSIYVDVPYFRSWIRSITGLPL